MKKKQIPLHLKTSLELITNAFPSGVSLHDIPYIAKILSQELSFENNALVLEYLDSDSNIASYYHEAMKGANLELREPRVLEILDLLDKDEYKDWQNEEEGP